MLNRVRKELYEGRLSVEVLAQTDPVILNYIQDHTKWTTEELKKKQKYAQWCLFAKQLPVIQTNSFNPLEDLNESWVSFIQAFEAEFPLEIRIAFANAIHKVGVDKESLTWGGCDPKIFLSRLVEGKMKRVYHKHAEQQTEKEREIDMKTIQRNLLKEIRNQRNALVNILEKEALK